MFQSQSKMKYAPTSCHCFVTIIANSNRNSLNEEENTQYYDLGHYRRAPTSASQEAQIWFDRGLIWCYSFNHEAALQCFERAIEYDANFVMPYWGIAYAIGPNYNKSWRLFTQDDRESTVTKALRALRVPKDAAMKISPLEEALITALSTRFPKSKDNIPEDMSPFNYDYAEAMRTVYQDYGELWR